MIFWLLSCEHAGNEVPEAYQHAFKEAADILQSHRGYDPAAFSVFRDWAPWADWATYYPFTRLLIEVNRSIGHPALFSTYSAALSAKEKKYLIQQYYGAYRNTIEAVIGEQLQASRPVVHIGVHSFTPVFQEKVRNADIGLLYDPANALEKAAAYCWKDCLGKEAPELKVRMNYPYLGKADGFTTYLRKKYPAGYAGIEFELNQKFEADLSVSASLKAAFSLFKEQFKG